ncbi:DUF6282 family protein [Oryzicola mucosus]|uniref:Cytosolic protein n=1 Tax=Oryzicola mucosus TaxID=2767425 RepID=A0A8J6U1L4_9HYPH|nr:DUF6282 family protein [Oryzicola mucosus]MBD0417086.1 hypothetical protein [Oryzicola mucosus]
MTTDQSDIDIKKSFGAERDAKIDGLLKGAVDLHCHSGPAAMPRILDHHEATVDAEEAGFRALVFKDHYYVGMSHCAMIEKLMPGLQVKLYSGVALNNPSGGINPHAVDHAIKTGGQIVWMPTLAARNHIDQSAKATKNFPASKKPMLKAEPLTVLDESGKLTDATLKILDLIAEADIILAGGHLHVSEQGILFDEAIRRGVKKMLVNHPTYVVEYSDEDIRSFAAMGVHMEHSICMFVEGRGYKHDGARLKQLIELAGLDKTLLCSDLGLTGSPRPVEGYRRIVNTLIEQGFDDDQIRALTGGNAIKLLPADG